MKHRTKQRLILLHTVLTVACVALCVSLLGYAWAFVLVWPEVLALLFIAGGADLTVLGVIIKCVLCGALLLHVAAPVCGVYRIYAPFKALLCVKAVLNLALFLLLPGWNTGLLLLLHGTLFVLATIFFRREGTEAAVADEGGA